MTDKCNKLNFSTYSAGIFQRFLEFVLPEENVTAGNTPQHSLEGRNTLTIYDASNEPEDQNSGLIASPFLVPQDDWWFQYAKLENNPGESNFWNPM